MPGVCILSCINSCINSDCVYGNRGPLPFPVAVSGPSALSPRHDRQPGDVREVIRAQGDQRGAMNQCLRYDHTARELAPRMAGVRHDCVVGVGRRTVERRDTRGGRGLAVTQVDRDVRVEQVRRTLEPRSFGQLLVVPRLDRGRPGQRAAGRDALRRADRSPHRPVPAATAPAQGDQPAGSVVRVRGRAAARAVRRAAAAAAAPPVQVRPAGAPHGGCGALGSPAHALPTMRRSCASPSAIGARWWSGGCWRARVPRLGPRALAGGRQATSGSATRSRGGASTVSWRSAAALASQRRAVAAGRRRVPRRRASR